jgi:hypothetical protein
MMGIKYLATFAAFALLAQPCAAADGFQASHAAKQVVGTFAGATLKLAADKNRRNSLGVQFGLGISHSLLNTNSAAAVHLPGIELRLTPSTNPLLLVSGQSPSTIERRLGIGPGAVLLAVGGLAAGAALVGGMAGGMSAAEKAELDRKQCFLPEKELCK